MQALPEPCADHIPTAVLSLCFRNLVDSEGTSFGLNEIEDGLPPPFPVFASWTRISEDQRVNEGPLLPQGRSRSAHAAAEGQPEDAKHDRHH